MIQIWRPRTGRVRLKIPFFEGTRFWLREVCGAGTRPDFECIVPGDIADAFA